jgi:chromosome segregation ATPase
MQVVKNEDRELKRYKKACYNMKTIIYDLRKKLAKEIKENELLKEEIEGDIITIDDKEKEKKKCFDELWELIEVNKILERENKAMHRKIEELKSGNEHYGKIIDSLEAEKKKLNDVIMQYENQNLELMKENQEQEQEIKRLKKLNDTLLNENSYLEDNSQRYKLENRRMKERLKEKGIEWI